jgi:hypothetical protein
VIAASRREAELAPAWNHQRNIASIKTDPAVILLGRERRCRACESVEPASAAIAGLNCPNKDGALVKKRRTKKDRQLVLQHLELVSWRVLEESPEIVRTMIKRRHGVYALYRKERLYYVGLATNLMGRLQSHLKDRHHAAWDRFSVYLTAHDDHIKEMESLILRITAPAGNKQSGKFSASVNLLSTLNRLMSDADADRRARLLGGAVARRRRRNKTKKAKGSLPLAGVVDRRVPLRATFKGYEYRATLRTDGRLSYSRVLYDSPTGAAKAAVGRTVNGWTFWKYRNQKREWVSLAQMRK